jgi:hypothetical protein
MQITHQTSDYIDLEKQGTSRVALALSFSPTGHLYLYTNSESTETVTKSDAEKILRQIKSKQPEKNVIEFNSCFGCKGNKVTRTPPQRGGAEDNFILRGYFKGTVRNAS